MPSSCEFAGPGSTLVAKHTLRQLLREALDLGCRKAWQARFDFAEQVSSNMSEGRQARAPYAK